MKKYALVILFLPLFSVAQKRSRSYFNIAAEMFSYSHSDPSFGGSISFGGKTKYIGIGMGAAVTLLSGTNSSYIPLYAEVSAYSNNRNKKTPNLYGCIQMGYGIYNSDSYSLINRSGGVYFSPGGGVLLPIKKFDLLIKLAYVRSSFNVKSNTGQHLDTQNSDGLKASVGLSF